MSWFTSIKNALSSSTIPSEAILLQPSGSGLRASDSTALQLPTVYSCVDRLSSGVASLPLITYRRMANGAERERAATFYLFDILRYQPNQWQTSFEFFQWMMVSACYRGNAYAYIDRRGGRVQQLVPMHPDRTAIMVPNDGTYEVLGYRYTPTAGGPIDFLPEEIYHVRGMPTTNPLVGTSIVNALRPMLNVALNLQDQVNNAAANGSRLSGIIKVPRAVDADQKKIIREEWHSVYGGSSNSYKVAVLGADADFKPISMTAVEAEIISASNLTVSQITGVFNIPPHMVGYNEHSTFSNIEHQDLAFVKHTLRPWLTRFELAGRRDLLTTKEKDNYFIEFLIDALLRGDYKTRQEGLRIKIESGQLSPNEARQLDNLNPRVGGDVYLTPLNMREAGPDAREPTDSTPAATPSNTVVKGPAAVAMVQENADRLFKRVKGPLLKAHRRGDNVVDACEDASALFTQYMGVQMSYFAPSVDARAAARAFESDLVKAVQNTDNVPAALATWQQTAMTNLESIAQ